MDNACTRLGRQAAAEALGRRPWGGGGHSRRWDIYEKSTFNALVISDDTDAAKTQRIRWLSQICEYRSGVEQSTELSLVGWNSCTGQGIKIALMATICRGHPDSYNRQLANYFVVFFPHSFPQFSEAIGRRCCEQISTSIHPRAPGAPSCESVTHGTCHWYPLSQKRSVL